MALAIGTPPPPSGLWLRPCRRPAPRQACAARRPACGRPGRYRAVSGHNGM